MKTNAMKQFLLGVLVTAGVFVSSPAQAALITTNSLVNATVIDFSDQLAQQAVYGPVQIGALVGVDVTVESSSDSNGLYFNFSAWGLGSNGAWGIPRTYVSLNESDDSMLFAFNDGPVSAVGGVMNYARDMGGLDLVITALDSRMRVLETYNITALADITTNAGAFRGIQRSRSDISFFQVSGGEANALDDLTFVSQRTRPTPVPEPSSLSLMWPAFAATVVLRRRR